MISDYLFGKQKEAIKMKKRVFVFEEASKKNIGSYQTINFKEKYSHIRGYHGCRALNLNDYYKNGIAPITKNEALKRALNLLRSDSIDEDKIVKVFDSHWTSLIDSHKCVWFTLTKDELVNFCGHYLIYGSEFICGMAAELFCQESLKKGIPTIFHCDVPIEKIPSYYIDELIESLRTGDGCNFGFKVIGAISKDEIVRCEHLEKIIDPLNGHIPYYWRQNDDE
jgi:hypothetical protein